MTQFCAICTDEVGPFDLLELDGRSYVACQKCLSEHPRDNQRKPVERGYNPSPSTGGMAVKARGRDRDLHGDQSWLGERDKFSVLPRGVEANRRARIDAGIQRGDKWDGAKLHRPIESDAIVPHMAGAETRTDGVDKFEGDDLAWFRKAAEK